MNALEFKEFRKKQGLTQVELAEKLNCTMKTISNYETGGPIPKKIQNLLLLTFPEKRVENVMSKKTIVSEVDAVNVLKEMIELLQDKIEMYKEMIQDKNKMLDGKDRHILNLTEQLADKNVIIASVIETKDLLKQRGS